MTARQRVRAVTGDGEQGSVLVIALAFMLSFGLLIGVVLQFGATSMRTVTVVRDAGTATYAGGGALDGAINAMSADVTAGHRPAAAAECFTLPADALDNTSAIAVTCEPRATSGEPVTGALASQPEYAVTALSSSDGLAVDGGTLSLQGGAAVDGEVAVAAGAKLDTTDYPTNAGTCPADVTTVLGTCTLRASGASAVVDPGYPGPNTAGVATQQRVLPPCAPTVTLQPGIYRSAAALQTVLGCAGSTIVLSTGTYFFDFQDAGSHELLVNRADVTLIGGARVGSSCNPALSGVDLVFGGDSRLRVTSGTVDLCALVPEGNTSQQHIVLRGLTSAVTVPTTGTAPGGGAPVSATLDKQNDELAVLNLTVPTDQVPPDATDIARTVTITANMRSDSTTASLSVDLLNPAGAVIASRVLVSCDPVANCTGTDMREFSIMAPTGTVPAGVQVRVSKPKTTGPGAGNKFATGSVAAVRLNLSYTSTVRRVCQTTTAALGCSGTPVNPVFAAAGPYSASTVALHGTLYAPTSDVNLSLTGVTDTVVDRGVIVRRFVSSMTTGGPAPMISVPTVERTPRSMIMTATDAGGADLGRSDVTFDDVGGGTGTSNGEVPEIVAWFVN